ncbi:hypothetical protein PSTG_00644 [Puccinia striiformis f. sp. tritici PST-78]|uniref:Uncharacterized protein n=1 Tax=Puccinia striiformis f. sp. tritici PST-78 TaxID=1165861 RepID=A0A0L0W3R6_9BASI|nr:hypothetical protein PSTG_00644 [Puccinia striiformis f. sp. tritici PST-78]
MYGPSQQSVHHGCMRSIVNRGHAPVESISAPAGVDVLISVLRKGFRIDGELKLGSSHNRVTHRLWPDIDSRSTQTSTSNQAQINNNQTQINVNQAEIECKSSSNQCQSSSD